MKLSNKILPQIKNNIELPLANYKDLPVKVLQFGTGVLLRGLPDYFIDKANKQGVFNGRVVVIKSTGANKTDAFAEQDNLYTVWVKGIKDQQPMDEISINSSISHVLTANGQWPDILKEADNANLKVVISNTTEVGIQLVNEDIHQSPPSSFPAKLLAVLYRRYQIFNGSSESGLVIIPTELLPDNATILKSILVKLCRYNKLEPAFEAWLLEHNSFCNSLVDRIVPGKPDNAEVQRFEEANGYGDDLLIVAEPYTLWAIEGDERVKAILSFEQTDEGVVVTPDIEIHRELKLRLLNGTHTLTCAMALLLNFDYVNQATADTDFARFMNSILADIRLAMPYKTDKETMEAFSAKVVDRFSNPYIKHLWVNIAQQYTTKIGTRVLPLLHQHFKQTEEVLQNIAKGLAAYLFLMTKIVEQDGKCSLEINGVKHVFTDEKAGVLTAIYSSCSPDSIAAYVFTSEELWGADKPAYPALINEVQKYLDEIAAGKVII